MKFKLEICADGIVIGILCRNGVIDTERTAMLVEMASQWAVFLIFRNFQEKLLTRRE